MEPQMVMELYKDRDKAEKLIRDMKEGTEIQIVQKKQSSQTTSPFAMGGQPKKNDKQGR